MRGGRDVIATSLPRVKVILGAYNGRTPSIEAQVQRVQRYIDATRPHFERRGTSESEYREWAMKFMAGALRNMADILSTE
jgi:hypothetical protein